LILSKPVWKHIIAPIMVEQTLHVQRMKN